ncbi:MAG: sugar porter family MFS transporter [Bacteroidetes bacterium]|nr:sugar porter family MFS transporter [Bacteroidota bacterium]
MKKTLLLYTFVAALGGLVFGFDTAVINGAMPFFVKHFDLTHAMQGWAVSSALIGCIIGAFFIGRPGDIFGRRYMLKVLSVLFIVSSIGTGLAVNLSMFVIFRFIAGLAIGGASVLSPMYISEIAPARQRGRLTATFQLAIVIGILVAFFSDYLLIDTGPANWRWMFMAGLLPGLALFILLYFVSESPRWLVKVGRMEEALAVIRSVSHETDPDQTLQEIRGSIDNEIMGKNIYLFRKPYLKLVLIGIAVGMFNQFTGINIIMYYATDIFRSAGFSTNSAIGQTVLIGLTNLVFTIIAMSIIDKIGRKTLLLIGSLGMTFFLGLFAYLFKTGNGGEFLLLGLLIGFIAFFAASQGAVIWVLLSEMFPNNIRARGTSLGSFSHWFFNALLSFLFPVVTGSFGVSNAFAFYAIATFISFFFFFFLLKETKGRSLEELEKHMLGK